MNLHTAEADGIAFMERPWCFDGDGVPEMAVGRLPVRTLAEANLVVSKIVNFTPPTSPQSAMMVADNPVDYDFVAFDEQLIQVLPRA